MLLPLPGLLRYCRPRLDKVHPRPDLHPARKLMRCQALKTPLGQLQIPPQHAGLLMGLPLLQLPPPCRRSAALMHSSSASLQCCPPQCLQPLLPVFSVRLMMSPQALLQLLHHQPHAQGQ